MRLSKLWRACGPANFVSSILTELGEIITQHADIAHEVGQVWGRTFTKTSPLPKEALSLLKKNCINWSMDGVHPPSVDCFAWFLEGLIDSAPGPDGIPYSCYKAMPRFSAWILFCCNWVLLSGGLLGVSFNIQRACFIPKNASTEGALPKASELRSLGLKNTDNKIITGANFRQFSALIADRPIYIQRGFVMFRQLALNQEARGSVRFGSV